MTHRPEKPVVLAVTRDSAYLRALRVDMPLLNLKKQGLIHDYFVTNPSFFNVPDDFLFDVVWLQRAQDPRLMEHLREKIDNHYLYDLDDLLIGGAAYRRQELLNRDTVLEYVKRCRTLVVTSSRLRAILQQHISPVSLESKTILCPNAFEFSGQLRIPSRPQGLLVTSSEDLPLMASGTNIVQSVAEFSDRHNLPVLWFGAQDKKVLSLLPNVTYFGHVSYWHYHVLLAGLPPLIGIAPIETEADEATLEFVAGKSDVKMVDYGGFGHPSLYSQAPPYVDTDLQAGLVVANTKDAWSEGLERIFEQGWNGLDEEQRRVIDLRNMNRIAAECWDRAVCAARLPEMITGREIKFSRGKTAYFINAAKHMVYSQDWLFLKGLQEQIPPRVLRFLRKFLLRG